MMKTFHLFARPPRISVSSPGTSIAHSLAYSSWSKSKTSSVNPCRAPSGMATSRTGRSRLESHEAAAITWEMWYRLRLISGRWRIPHTVVTSPTAVYGAIMTRLLSLACAGVGLGTSAGGSDGRPNPFRIRRHIHVLHPQRRQRVHHRVHHRGRRGDGPRLGDTLGAEGIHGARRDDPIEIELGYLGRARDQIGEERRRFGGPVRRVGDLLQQRLAQPLGDAAVHLPLHQHGVHHVPAVVHGDVPDQLHEAGLHVHL